MHGVPPSALLELVMQSSDTTTEDPPAQVMVTVLAVLSVT